MKSRYFEALLVEQFRYRWKPAQKAGINMAKVHDFILQNVLKRSEMQ